MKTFIPVLALLIFSIADTFAYCPVAWKKSFPMTRDQGINAIAKAQNGGYILGASQDVSGYGRCYVVRITESGDIVWTRAFGTQLCEVLGLSATTDGGCVLTGNSCIAGNMYIMKLDSMGQQEWIRIDPYYYTGSRSVRQTIDGGYIAVGSIYAGPSSSSDFYIIRLDADGDSLWSIHMGSPYEDLGGRDILCTSDSNYFAVGSISHSSWQFGAACYKLHENGSVAWTTNYYINNGGAEALAICQRTDHRYTIVGHVYSSNDHDYFIETLNEYGGTVWTRIYGGPGADIARGVVATSDNGAIVVGTSTSNNSGIPNPWIVRLANYGAIEWDYQIPNINTPNITDIEQSSDGGYVIVGSISLGSPNGNDMLLIKLCPDGSNAGYVKVIANGTLSGGYRLLQDDGSLNRLIFTNVDSGTIGWVTGSASANWQCLPNGDGNNGDSVIFESSIPLIAGSIDTFWVSRPEKHSEVSWIAGCVADTTHIWNGEMRYSSFRGAWLAGGIEIRVHTDFESNLGQIKILSRYGTAGSFGQITQQTAVNDSNGHEYIFSNLPCRNGLSYIFAVTDIIGSTIYIQDTLKVGTNVPVNDNSVLNPSSFMLSSFPNPFNPSTTLSFTLPQTGEVKLEIFDIMGRKAGAQLCAPTVVYTAGEHHVAFDGSSLPSGIYFARLESSGMVKTQKLLLLK